MIETLENVLGAVVLIGLIAAFVLAFIGLFGWAIIMTVDALKEHFKDGKGDTQ